MPNVEIGVALVVRRVPNVLVHRRLCAVGYGSWSLPGGHIEKWETFEETALRELREEAGPNLEVTQPVFWTAINCFYRENDHHTVTILMISNYIDGEAIVAEPDKAEQWLWCPWDDIPTPRMQGLQQMLDDGFEPWGAFG